MKRLTLIFLLLLLASKVQAVAYQSNGTGGGLYDVGASWNPVGVPGAADSFDLLVGDTITLNGNVTVGNNAANDTTYNINIQGNLVWPQTPGGNWTFKASSSIRLQGAGKFYVGCTPGAPTDRLNCANYAIIEFQTGGGIKYDIRIDGASAQLIARGCEGYHASSGTETRARITACNPDCNAGAGRILTLDTTVNWVTNPAIINPVTAAGTGNAEAIVGEGGNLSIPGGFNSEILEITAVPASNQITVTLANNHQTGDMVVNPTKNILFMSANVANHSSIYCVPPSGTTLPPFGLTWVRLDEMGDSTGATNSAIGIDLNAPTSSFGTIEYTWLTNCEDGAGTTCFYIAEGDWTTFDYNGVFNSGVTGRGVYILQTRPDKLVTGFTAIRSGYTNGQGWYNTTAMFNIAFDKFWASGNGTHFLGGAQGFTDSLFHHSSSTGLDVTYGYNYEKRRPFVFRNNEVRNSTAINTYCARIDTQNTQFTNNDFDNCSRNCLYLADDPLSSNEHFLANNTFDGCNYGNVVGNSYGGIFAQQYNGTFYSQDDDFGSTSLNNRNNISFKNLTTTTSYLGNHKIIINNPILNGPNNPSWAYPITLWQWPTNWLYRYSYGSTSSATIHNEDQVAGAHFGFGPGGMIIEHVTGAGPTGGWVDNTVNMKVIPFAGDRYCRVHLGKVHVESGDVLQVNLQIQKNQAITNGRRPRLVLKGCGFDPTTDYDEMADVNNSWDTVTVSGTATFNGGVHAYLEVLNDLAGDPTYPTTKPVDPPTIIIYADGSSWNKT